MSKKKDVGVPPRKTSGSRVARVPSPKKATASRRSTRSRAGVLRNRDACVIDSKRRDFIYEVGAPLMKGSSCVTRVAAWYNGRVTGITPIKFYEWNWIPWSLWRRRMLNTLADPKGEERMYEEAKAKHERTVTVLAKKSAQRLVWQYLDQTCMMSVTLYALKLPVAQALLLKKEKAAPILLEVLRAEDGGMAVITLLQEMFPDADPYTPDKLSEGFVAYKVDSAMSAWINWGISANIIPATAPPAIGIEAAAKRVRSKVKDGTRAKPGPKASPKTKKK